jgi:hypothetical protein
MHWPRKIRWSVNDEFDRMWKKNGVQTLCRPYDMSRAAFLKLWSADHKWSSGSALVGPLRLNISKKNQKKNNVNCVSHTIVENLKQFAFKADKSRVVRRTLWLIKVVPIWKKVWETLDSRGSEENREDGQSQGQDMNLRPTEYKVFVTDARSYLKLWDIFGHSEETYPAVFLLNPGLLQVGRNRHETYYFVDPKQLLMKRPSWVQLPGIQGICAVNCCHERRQLDCNGCASTERQSVLWCIRSRRR